MEQTNNYESFCEQMKEAVVRAFPEHTVEVRDVVKNNGLHLDSLMIRKEGEKISPNFYLNQLYEEYQQGKSVREILDDMVRLHEQSIQEYENLKIDFTYESCKDKIVLRLASGEWNSEILEEIPYIPFLDMVIVFCVVLRVEKDEIGSVRISNQLQEQWDISTQSLFVQALENSQRLFPAKSDRLLHMLEERMPMAERREFATFLEREYEEEEDASFVLTNTCGINGATVILYPDVLRQMGERFGRDYYLLPSSIHEFLAVPCHPGLSGDKLEFMVREVNRTCVAREELLSEKVYYYRIQTGKVLIWNDGKSSS